MNICEIVSHTGKKFFASFSQADRLSVKKGLGMTPQLEKIWQQFSGELRRFILSKVRDEMVADDLLQEVFLKIHHGIAQLRDVGRLESWVYRIARNVIHDYYRQQRFFNGELAEIPAEETAVGVPVGEQLAGGLHAMIEALPEIYREPLRLTVFEGLPQAEVARRLGLSVSGAKSRVQRGRQLLKKMLLECCHFEFDRRGMVLDFHPRERCDCGCETEPPHQNEFQYRTEDEN